MITSPKFTLNVEDAKALGKGLLIALAGAALTYVTEQIPNVDFGQWTPLVVATWSVVVNTARKWITENRYVSEEEK